MAYYCEGPYSQYYSEPNTIHQHNRGTCGSLAGSARYVFPRPPPPRGVSDAGLVGENPTCSVPALPIS